MPVPHHPPAVIWYGSWANASQVILRDAFTSIAATPWLSIGTTYGDAAGAVGTDVGLAGESSDAYSLGTSLTDANIFAIVTAALAAGRLPVSSNALYYVLTSQDVTASR